MKKIFNLFIIAGIGIFVIFSCKPANKYSSVKLKTPEDSISYYMGLYYGAGWEMNNIDSILNPEAFIKGINEAFNNDTLDINTMDLEVIINKYFILNGFIKP